MPEKILIIDDNTDNLVSLELLLKSYPQELDVIKADSGAQALKIMEQETFSAALIDIRMPEIDGYEVCRRIRADYAVPYVSVILITAHALSAEDRITGYDAGCDDYVLKPIDRDELFARLRSVLRTRELQEDLRAERDSLEENVQERTQELFDNHQRLMEGEEKLRTVVTNSEAVIFILDELGYFELSEGRALASLGLKPGQVVGQSSLEVYKDFPQVIKSIKGALKGKTTQSDLDVGGVIFNVHYNPVKDNDGKVIRVVGIATDITDRKQAEEEIRNKTRLSKILLDAFPCVALLLRPKTREIVASNAAAIAVGAVPGKTCYATWGQSDKPCPWCLAPKAWKNEEYQQCEPEGLGRVFDAHWVPISDDLYMHFAFDITERKRSEEKLISAEGKVQQFEKMQAIGQLAAGIAHDFNNILGAMIGYTDLTREELPTDSMASKNLTKVLQAGERAKHLVNQILMFSRQSSEIKKPVYLRPIIREVVDLMRASLPSSIELKTRIEKDTQTVLADPTKIHEIIMNLCTNAAHAVNEKGLIEITHKEVQIEEPVIGIIGTSEPGSYSVVAVKDSGCGMDELMRGRIFEPFFTSKEQGEGTGMGLSVVYGIIQSHNGNIIIDSEPEKGTAFYIYLPKIEDVVEEEIGTTADIPKGSERILFIDDEEMLLETTQDILESLGYRVEANTDSLKALDLFKKNPKAFDLVITDQTMPVMNGFELAQEMMAVRKDMPIVLCTGYSKSVNEEKAKATGIKAYCMKPLSKREIAGVIRGVLDNGGNGNKVKKVKKIKKVKKVKKGRRKKSKV